MTSRFCEGCGLTFVGQPWMRRCCDCYHRAKRQPARLELTPAELADLFAMRAASNAAALEAIQARAELVRAQEQRDGETMSQIGARLLATEQRNKPHWGLG